MYIDQQNLTTHGETQSVTPFSIEQLGKEITARIEAGNKAAEQAKERLLSAGLMLIEAKNLVSNFSAFLREHCNGLSRSRAYELIKIAGGKTNEVRARTNERKRRHRLKQAAPVAHDTVRSGTDTTSASEMREVAASAALSEFKSAVDLWFPRMGDATREAALAYATRWSAG